MTPDFGLGVQFSSTSWQVAVNNSLCHRLSGIIKDTSPSIFGIIW